MFQIFTNIIEIFFSVVMVIAVLFMHRIPYIFQQALHDNRKAVDSSDLQRESFFKKISGEEQEKVFDQWTRQITYMGEDNDTDKLLNLVHRTVLFGSNRTVAYISSMMQYIYKHPNNDDNEANNYMIPMYASCIISSLKQDFSGYEISPIQIIQLKISDYSEHEDEYKKCVVIIDKDVEKRLRES